MGITVAVTGPTGEIGVSAVTALEAEPEVDLILGMARRPFDPATRGWTKTRYRRGDVLDRKSVDALIDEADVVVHLAYLIMADRELADHVNLQGSRHVFEATVARARPRRLVYTSSVAAYGYHRDNPSPLTEDVPPRGSPKHYYSREKAQCEAMLADLTGGSDLEVYVLRPCIVAGPRATALARFMPWNRSPLAGHVKAIGRWLPPLRPVFPDPGVDVQLVHHDDVARAIVSAALGRGSPGTYNLAGDGTVSFSDIVAALGGRGVRIPGPVAVAASDLLGTLPAVPSILEWIHVGRTSVVMDTSRAKRQLDWHPAYTSAETLASMAAAVSQSND